MTYEEAERKVRSENCILPSAIIKDKEDDPNAPIIFYTEEEMAAMKSEQMGEATWQAIIREMERNEAEEKAAQCIPAPTNTAQNETLSSVPAEPDTHMSVIPAPTAAVPHPPTPPVSVNTTPLRHVMSAIRK